MLSKEDLLNSSLESAIDYMKYICNIQHKINFICTSPSYHSAINEFNEKINIHKKLIKQIINYKIIYNYIDFIIPQCNIFII